MKIKLIKTEQEYQAALSAVAPLFDNEPALITLNVWHSVKKPHWWII